MWLMDFKQRCISVRKAKYFKELLLENKMSFIKRKKVFIYSSHCKFAS